MGRRILFTNVKYLVGGGKTGVPARFRRGQNIHIYLDDYFDEINLKDLPRLLHSMYNGKIVFTKSTVAKIRERR